MKTLWLSNSDDDLEIVQKLLRSDEIVALPTETVYGLAGNAFSKSAIQKIFTAKERPSNDPLIVHISKRLLKADTLSNLENLGIVDLTSWSTGLRNEVTRLLNAFWPGPLTIVLPKGKKIPDLVTSNQPTVGIRCPDHEVFQNVLQKLPFPLAAPSANRFGRISPTQAKHVEEELNERISAIVDGGSCKVGLESTIIRIESPLKVTLLRPGKIGVEEIENFLGCKANILKTITENTLTPGTLEDHYAPRKPLYLLDQPFSRWSGDPLMILPEDLRSKKVGLLKMSGIDQTLTLEDAAAQLYHKMRLFDQDPAIEVILADVPIEKEGLGAAIRDRLKRASRNKPKI